MEATPMSAGAVATAEPLSSDHTPAVEVQLDAWAVCCRPVLYLRT